MTFEELGANLRAEREKRHLSIEDVANQLKINPRLLLALEAGDGHALPHPAYARGFIRSYANFLGFSPDEIQQWLANFQPDELHKPKPAVEAEVSDYIAPVERQKKGAGKAIVALLILCGLAGGGYWLWQSGRLPFLEVKKERPSDIINALPAADTYQPQPEVSQTKEDSKPQTVPVPIEKPETLIESATAKSSPVSDIPAENQEATSAEPESEQAAQDSEATAEPHKVVIVATEECWVHSTADKTDTRQFSLRKGDTFALTFADMLELKLGNAGGVRLRYDGVDMPPAGTSGQVRTVTFPPKSD